MINFKNEEECEFWMAVVQARIRPVGAGDGYMGYTADQDFYLADRAVDELRKRNEGL